MQSILLGCSSWVHAEFGVISSSICKSQLLTTSSFWGVSGRCQLPINSRPSVQNKKKDSSTKQGASGIR
jgi:hypothetical protein